MYKHVQRLHGINGKAGGRRKCSVCAVQLQSTGKSFEFFPIWMFALVLLMLNRFLVLISYSLCGGQRETREEDEK